MLTFKSMERLIGILESISERTGEIFSWATSFLVWLICLDVLMRYAFNFTLIWIIELETYFFALIFIMGSAYAFKYDKHVRVDLFYSKYSKVKKAWTDLLGGIFFLLPWTAMSAYVCFYYFLKSWHIGETSSQPGGLPALYILKFVLFAGFLLMVIQAIASILKSLLVIMSSKTDINDTSVQDAKTMI